MVKISKKDLDGYSYIYKDKFIKFNNEKALYKTKFVSEMKHNGEIVEVIGMLKGKDVFNDRYIVRFNDGTIENNIISTELNFNYPYIKKILENLSAKKEKENGR